MNQPVIEKFGKYSFLRKIGQGGMAEVYLAVADDQPPNTPPIVIKRLLQNLERDRDAVDLFLTEADVTMMLDHPNVIRVYDAGEVNGRYFMAMEYIHGKDLEQICDRFVSKAVHIDPDAAVFIMAEVLKGLDYVHNAKTLSGRQLGIVHRDVTPSNVYVSSNGRIKLGDFGVAKLIGVEGWTMAGSLKGKLGYLSPEQVAGEPPTPMIDLWAAAVIMYELLANHRGFVGANELDIMLRIKSAKIPRIRKVYKEAPKPLEKILEKALHKKMRKRFQSAREFLTALEEYQAKNKRYSEAELVQYFTRVLA